MPKFYELEKIRDNVCNIHCAFSIKDKKLNIFGKNQSIIMDELPANDVLFLGETHDVDNYCGNFLNLNRLIEQFDYVFLKFFKIQRQ